MDVVVDVEEVVDVVVVDESVGGGVVTSEVINHKGVNCAKVLLYQAGLQIGECN